MYVALMFTESEIIASYRQSESLRSNDDSTRKTCIPLAFVIVTLPVIVINPRVTIVHYKVGNRVRSSGDGVIGLRSNDAVLVCGDVCLSVGIITRCCMCICPVPMTLPVCYRSPASVISSSRQHRRIP